MQYMLLIYDDESQWPEMSDEDRGRSHQAYGAYTQALKDSGAFIAGDALQSVGTSTTVRVRDGETLTTDGPFAETKEQLGGYYLIDVESLDEALAWAARIPSAAVGSIEVRPVMVISMEAPA